MIIRCDLVWSYDANRMVFIEYSLEEFHISTGLSNRGKRLIDTIYFVGQWCIYDR